MMTQSGFEKDTFKALMEGYLSQIKKGDALNKFRSKAWDQFLELGLPTNKSEVYRYIKLRQLFSQQYHLPGASQLKAEEIAKAIYPECRKSFLVFVNGHYFPHLSNRQSISQKVSISSLLDATSTFGTFLNNFWMQSLKNETDPFAVLNSALHQDGIFIYIPPKTIIESPIQILHIITDEEKPLLVMPRLNIFAGAQSQVEIVTNQISLTKTSYFVNQVTELSLDEEAHVHYTQLLCEENEKSWHLDAFRTVLKRNASLKTVFVTEGSSTVRQDYRISMVGENAEALLNGVCMLAGKRESHVNIYMEHQAPHCRSNQLFKTVLNDFSRSSFEGKIMVRQAAQKTEAFQLNSNLLLSEHAHADSKPNLEIFADDVKASHGATVGQLNEDHLFYMRTRGFPEHEAKNLLIYGFCEQVIEMIRLPSLLKSISAKLKQYISAGE